MTDPDPRTAPDDDEDATATDDATNHGESARAPAEGGDDVSPQQPGSPEG